MQYQYWDLIQENIAAGYITTQQHPTLPLTIYNYTRLCQFRKAWNPATLAARGLILDQQGHFVAKGLDKFFNYEELNLIEMPAMEYAWRQEKADGSFGIIFNYQGEWLVATRGSFQSLQAQQATQILWQKYNPTVWDTAYIYLVEIIYPANQIVVSYAGAEKLIMLAILDKRGQEIEWETTVEILQRNGVPLTDITPTQKFTTLSVAEIMAAQAEDLPNMEGYVYRLFPSNQRFKAKFPTYITKHKVITNITNFDIWELLKEQKDPLVLLEIIPDEIDEWFRREVATLEAAYQTIEAEIQRQVGKLNTQVTKKEWATQVATTERKYQAILYRWFEQKDYSAIIWALIKPKFKTPWSNQ